MNPSTVSYSTLSHSAAASEISRAYTVEGLTSCEFLNRGLNDTFRVQTAGRRFVFRVYRHAWRSRSETVSPARDIISWRHMLLDFYMVEGLRKN